MATQSGKRKLRFRDGVPFDETFDDVYYPANNPEEDTRHTYLKGAQIDRLFESKERVIVAETGFGTGSEKIGEAFQGHAGLRSHYRE